MKICYLIISFILFSVSLLSDTLKIGTGQKYASLQSAAVVAEPGDVLLFVDKNIPGGMFISGLLGNPSGFITITSESRTVISGGGNAIQFSDVNWLIISNLIIEGQTGNGLNIDDGSSYDSPTSNIIIRDVEFRALNASGNNDQLKMSGVDTLLIENCTFTNGSTGGSMIDMVGCHWGEIKSNKFNNAGSNAIQAKGGSSDITITMNSFVNAGQRAINIGGSTGTAYFRPMGAKYESMNIKVWSNFFSGSLAPVAFVGTVNSEVVNNTIYNPDKWVMRILQENLETGMEPCANNRFINNIVIVGNKATNPSINIGPNTMPETFVFENNLWYNYENPAWGGPSLPSAEVNSVLRSNPMLQDIQNGDIQLLLSSPAKGKGKNLQAPVTDYYGNSYNIPRCIGAAEDTIGISVIDERNVSGIELKPNPANDKIRINLKDISIDCNDNMIFIYDSEGRIVFEESLSNQVNGTETVEIDVSELPPGVYFLNASCRLVKFVVR